MFEFLLGSAMTLVYIAVLALICLFTVSYERWGWSTIISLGLVLLVGKMYDFDFSYVYHNPASVLILVAYYLGIGVVWSFGKWYFTLNGAVASFKEYKERYLKSQNRTADDFLLTSESCNHFVAWAMSTPLLRCVDDLNDVLKDAIRENDNKPFGDRLSKEEVLDGLITRNDIIDAIRPTAGNNKARITAWITFWPMSALGTLLDDPLRKLVEYIFSKLKNVYEIMSRRMFKEI